MGTDESTIEFSESESAAEVVVGVGSNRAICHRQQYAKIAPSQQLL